MEMSEHDKLLKKIVEAKLALYKAQVRREKEKEMKTIREWLNELPELIRSRAIRNAEDYHKSFLDESEISLREAVFGAFIWHETPEGYEFWSAVSMGETPELPDHLKDEE